MNEKENLIQTPHIVCDKRDVAKVVVMPGDPVRAKAFAKKYLKNMITVNGVRNHFIYTGEYQGMRISVCPSQMGIGSAAIYFYELFNFVGVKTIIRMGTCGGYNDKLVVGDLLLVDSFYTDTNFYENFTGTKNIDLVNADQTIIRKVKALAKAENINIQCGRTYSSDVFYTQKKNIWQLLERAGTPCDVVEMEGFALQTIANFLGKNAITLLSVSDNLVTKTFSSAQQRAEGLGQIFNLTIKTALMMNNYLIKGKGDLDS